MAAEESLADRLGEAFADFSSLPGIRVELETASGARVEIVDGPAAAEPSVFAVEENGARLLVFLSSPASGAEAFLLDRAVRAVLDKIEVEKREEQLLDELGTNWESLEALYEISTDVLRFGDVRSALKRLIERFTSLQDSLRACLLITRSGRLEPILGNPDVPPAIDWRHLGPIATPILESRAVVINEAISWPDSDDVMPWREATSLAAAPVTSRRQTVIGLLLVWREDRRFEFDAPFCRLLEAITHQASMLLESDRLNRTMLENDRLAKEIEIASSIQQTLLLGNAPADIPSLQLAAYSAASQHIDGDFLDFLKHDGAVDVLIGDVMGKGVAAALLGAATKNQFLRAIANLSIKGGVPSPVDIVNRAASRLGARLVALERFVTICYARFDPARGCVEYVDCGHTGILVHRKLTGETFFLRGDDLPLGIYLEDTWHQHSAPLMPGDTFLLFSDGVTETKNRDGDLFGEERLIECVETWSSLGPDLLLEQIRRECDAFRAGESLTDDFSCIGLRVHPGPEDVLRSSRSQEFAGDLEFLTSALEWLRETAELGPEGLMRLESAAAEIFANCVLHGSGKGSGEEGGNPVRIDVLNYADHAKVEFRHAGPPFDPMSVPPPSFDGSRDGGFGTFIIMRSADELIYARNGAINSISVIIMARLS